MKKALFLLLALSCLAFLEPPKTDSFSQWRGPNRDGVYNETNLLKSWPEDGPPLLWSIDQVDAGYSSPAVTDDAIFVTGTKDTTDYITALDKQGNVLWRHAYGPAWDGDYPPARCTPTVKDGKVYVTSGQGTLACFVAESGKKLWSVNATEMFGGRQGIWGVAENLLIVDDNVIFTPGGEKTTMVAFNKGTGALAWQSPSLNDTTAYVSPILVEHGGKKMIVNLLAHNIFGVDPDNGSILWSYRYSDVQRPMFHPAAPFINCNTPLYKDGHIYVTSGYNHVGAMFKLADDASSVAVAWTDTTLDTHIGGVVRVGDKIFGANWINNRTGNWCSIDWKTGEKLYETTWNTKGSIIYADGMLYCYEERRGNVALVDPSAEDFKVVSSFRITQGSGPHWSHPVIRNGVLYMRHGTALMAYNVKQGS